MQRCRRGLQILVLLKLDLNAVFERLGRLLGGVVDLALVVWEELRRGLPSSRQHAHDEASRGRRKRRLCIRRQWLWQLLLPALNQPLCQQLSRIARRGDSDRQLELSL